MCVLTVCLRGYSLGMLRSLDTYLERSVLKYISALRLRLLLLIFYEDSSVRLILLTRLPSLMMEL